MREGSTIERVIRTGWRPGLNQVQQAATVEGEGKRMQSLSPASHNPPHPRYRPKGEA